MKKIITSIIISCIAVHTALFAQTSISSTGTPANASAQLDVSSANKGLLVPRLTTTQRNAITSPAKGLLVYDSTLNLFWFYNGALWQQLSASEVGWSVTGNGGISPSADFLGTTNKKPLVLKVNNILSGYTDTALNAVLGQGALSANISGSGNAVIGAGALHADTSAEGLVAIGDSALYNNLYNHDNDTSYLSGVDNTAIGSKSLFGNTGGDDNTAIGYQTLYSNTAGARNTATGIQSLHSVTFDVDNTAFGYTALTANTGDCNTAIGNGSLGNGGSYSTAIGYGSLGGGNYNTAIGGGSLVSNTNGAGNTADGAAALPNQGGSYNTAIGYSALGQNASQHSNYVSNNTATGYEALERDADGASSTASGYQALYSFTGLDPSGNIGAHNTALGASALYSDNDGTSNTAIGYEALYRNTGGYNNIAAGYKALYANTTGKSSIALGYNAGIHFVTVPYHEVNPSTIADNVFLGANTDVSGNDSLGNVVAIGQAVACTADNQVRIGNSAITSIGGYANWSNISDRRVKKHIRQNVPGLAFISRLTPVTYNLDIEAADSIVQSQQNNAVQAAAASSGLESNNEEAQMSAARKEKETIVYSGFIAQDVEKAAEKSSYDFSGVNKPENGKGLYTLRYADLIAPLVKAVQELSKTNNELKKKHAALEARLEKAEAALLSQQK